MNWRRPRYPANLLYIQIIGGLIEFDPASVSRCPVESHVFARWLVGIDFALAHNRAPLGHVYVLIFLQLCQGMGNLLIREVLKDLTNKADVTDWQIRTDDIKQSEFDTIAPKCFAIVFHELWHHIAADIFYRWKSLKQPSADPEIAAAKIYNCRVRIQFAQMSCDDGNHSVNIHLGDTTA